jgi:diaminopropionate ammonia-lyase
VCAAFWIRLGERRPRCVIVEPVNADCFFRSVAAGRPVGVQGGLDTVMAGLACGEVSELGWEILKQGADAVVAIGDDWAIEAVKRLAHPQSDDAKIVAGETGGAGLAALLAVHGRPELEQALGLGRDSKVLLLGSEGDTDPDIYRRIVGQSAEEVLAP